MPYGINNYPGHKFVVGCGIFMVAAGSSLAARVLRNRRPAESEPYTSLFIDAEFDKPGLSYDMFGNGLDEQRSLLVVTMPDGSTVGPLRMPFHPPVDRPFDFLGDNLPILRPQRLPSLRPIIQRTELRMTRVVVERLGRRWVVGRFGIRLERYVEVESALEIDFIVTREVLIGKLRPSQYISTCRSWWVDSDGDFIEATVASLVVRTLVG